MAKILELFGEPYDSDASRKRFMIKNYDCPYDNRLNNRKGSKAGCAKTIKNVRDLRSGNCSLFIKDMGHIICPYRFYEDNYKVLKDVKNFVWGNDTSALAHDELKLTMGGKNEGHNFGSLDWLITKNDNSGDFIGVEIQANSTTGTGAVTEAIKDLNTNKIKENYTVALNSLDTIKKFMTQFIFKGQLFDDWKMPYVAIIQDHLWDQLMSRFRIRAREVTEYHAETFMFFVYKFERTTDRYQLVLDKVMSTRWIDFLFAYSVDPDNLISYESVIELINKKTSKVEGLTL